jgi:hypothetical protein
VALVTLKKDPVYRDARRNGAQTKIELHIQDDDGTPVPDAKIKAYLGMNFRPLGTWINGTTDTNGVFVLEGKTCGDEIEVFVAKDGYYGSHVVYCYAKMGEERDVKDGKWQPYGEELQITLRKKESPAALVFEDFWVFKPTKAINQWVGFDICKNDFVKPNGSGDFADFEVFFDWDGNVLSNYAGMSVELRFADKYSGYYVVPACRESAFSGPYRADAGREYDQKRAVFFEKVDERGGRTRKNFNDDECWVVRTRCKIDEYGKLISCHYAAIRSVAYSCRKKGEASFCLSYVFNPTPNDTNLEPLRKRRKRGKKNMPQR